MHVIDRENHCQAADDGSDSRQEHCQSIRDKRKIPECSAYLQGEYDSVAALRNQGQGRQPGDHGEPDRHTVLPAGIRVPDPPDEQRSGPG